MKFEYLIYIFNGDDNNNDDCNWRMMVAWHYVYVVILYKLYWGSFKKAFQQQLSNDNTNNNKQNFLKHGSHKRHIKAWTRYNYYADRLSEDKETPTFAALFARIDKFLYKKWGNNYYFLFNRAGFSNSICRCTEQSKQFLKFCTLSILMEACL